MRHSDLVLLGLLADGAQHAYGLDQRIERMRIRSWARISSPTVYRRLNRLEEMGSLEAEREREGQLPERTVYRLTPAGEERLADLSAEALASGEPAYSDRLVGAVFSPVALTPEARRELLDAAVDEVEEKRRRLRESAREAEGEPISPVGAAIVDFYSRVAEAEARLLRTLRDLPSGGRPDLRRPGS